MTISGFTGYLPVGSEPFSSVALDMLSVSSIAYGTTMSSMATDFSDATEYALLVRLIQEGTQALHKQLDRIGELAIVSTEVSDQVLSEAFFPYLNDDDLDEAISKHDPNKITIAPRHDLSHLVINDSPTGRTIQFPSGIIASVQQQGKYRWVAEISMIIEKERLSISRVLDLKTLGNDYREYAWSKKNMREVGKSAASAHLGLIAAEIITVRSKIKEIIPKIVQTIGPIIKERGMVEEDDLTEASSIQDELGKPESFYTAMLMSTSTYQYAEIFRWIKDGTWGQTRTAGHNYDIIIPTNELVDGVILPYLHPFSPKNNAANYLQEDEQVIALVLNFYDWWYSIKQNGRDKRIEEILQMPKGTKIFYRFSGSETQMSKMVKTLQKNSHEIILDSKQQMYLKIQSEESGFIKTITRDIGCDFREMNEDNMPSYGPTLCGKQAVETSKHQSYCNSCRQIIKAEEKRKVDEAARLAAIAKEPAYPDTVSPDGVYKSGFGSMLPINPLIPSAKLTPAQELAQYQSLNGPIINVKIDEIPDIPLDTPPPAEIDIKDLQAVANYYSAVSDKHKEASDHYASLALHYSELAQEDEEVRKAREAYEQAIQRKNTMINNLQAMLENEPAQ